MTTETTTEQQTEPDTEAIAPDPDTANSTEDTDGSGTDDAARKARTDAAGYRRRLRDTEAERDSIAAERDALLERVTARQRADVEALAARQLADGTDIWQAIGNLADVLDATGDIDEAKVTAAVAGLVEAKPHYRRPRVGWEMGPRTPVPSAQSGWGDVLRGR